MAAKARAISAAALCLAVACGKSESAQEAPPAAAAPPRRSTAASIRPRTARRSRRPRRSSTAAPPGDDHWKSLSKALLELHNAIVFRDSSPLARETSRRLFFFSAQVDAATTGTHVDEQLQAMRGAWERIRAEQFASADWFHN